MSNVDIVDKRQVRRSFARAAHGYDAAAGVPREIGARMGERLDLLRGIPTRALDLGSGTGEGARRLRQRYADCTVIELDFAHPMLLQSRQQIVWWRRGIGGWGGNQLPQVCADMEHLPFADRVFDMVWSNLALQWVTPPQQAFAEIYRVLRPGGVCMFNTLGPDTLKELRASFATADPYVHVNPFIDLHDLGDMLVSARFADPVMDMEYLTLTYTDAGTLMRELKALGAGNASAMRNPALSGKGMLAAAIEAYERYRKDGRLSATLEVVYGHAWRPLAERRTADGSAVIEFQRRPGRDG